MSFYDFILFYYGYNILLSCKQYKVIDKALKENKLKNVCFQAIRLDRQIPNGLKDYINHAARMVKIYKEQNDAAIKNISFPKNVSINYLDEDYKLYEKVGICNIHKCGFVLVAGGIGERMRCDKLKVSLPINQITGISHLNLYFKHILSYESLMNTTIFICIMTSQSTNRRIRHYLEENNYFGLAKDQIFIIQQSNVPSFCDEQCNLSYESGIINSKPHGHGDVHYLLYQSKVLDMWKENGIENLIIFQDTNSLVFEAIPILLGYSIINSIDVNYLTVERYRGEKASIMCSCEDSKRKYDLRAIDYSLLPNLIGENINHCTEIISQFPAVTNVICFEINNYYMTIKQNNKLPEYILTNNMYKSFRLESVLQDYLLLTDNLSKTISIIMPRWLCFNPVKNISNSFSIYTPDDGENKIYIKNINKLRKLGWDIGNDSIIYIDPLLTITTDCINSHFSNIKITTNSKLIITGNAYINNLELDGC